MAPGTRSMKAQTPTVLLYEVGQIRISFSPPYRDARCLGGTWIGIKNEVIFPRDEPFARAPLDIDSHAPHCAVLQDSHGSDASIVGVFAEPDALIWCNGH